MLRTLAFLLLLALPAAAAPAETTGLADIVAPLFPTVVNITTMKPGDNGGPARRAFGTGFIVEPRGFIITNRHVVEGGYRVTATLNDGRTYTAKVLATNAVPDIAMLKIERAEPFPFARFGDSDALRRGETLIAIGNPLGLAGSVTVGVVSALNRNLNASFIDDFIQTDTSINHGNSGGPLFNLKGEVIGVNVAFVTPTDDGGSIGLGLAIPSNTVLRMREHFLKYGRLNAGFPGMAIQPLTPELAAALGAPGPEGGIVTEIWPGSPAEKADIRPGDVVMQLGARRTADARAMYRELGAYTPGTTVTAKIFRHGKLTDVPLTLSTFPPEFDPVGEPAMVEIGPRDTSPGLGMTLAEPSAEKRAALQKIGIPQAVEVAKIALNSPAGDLGLGAGDIIVRVGETQAHHPADVLAAVDRLRKSAAKHAMLLVQTAGKLQWMAAALTE